MLKKYTYVFSNTTLIVLLVLVSLGRISMVKLPYWTTALVLMYYTFAFKFKLNAFDTWAKRVTADSQLKIISFFLLIYASLILLIKLALGISYLIDTRNTFLNASFFKGEILAKNSQGLFGDYTFSLETFLDVLIIINTTVNLFLMTKNKNGNEEIPIEEHKSNVTEIDINIYTDYKYLKIFSTYFFSLQFILLCGLIISNVTILNSFNLLIFSLFTISAFLNSFKYLQIFNSFFSLVSFFSLNFHFFKNLKFLKNEKYDNLLGLLNLNSNYSIAFFTFYILAYINSCNIQKYSLSKEEKEIIKSNSKHKEIKTNFRQINNFTFEAFKLLRLTTINVASICYNIILLFWILFHVCIVMFLNFLFLFFGVTKAKNSPGYKKYFVIPTFIISLLFIIAQFVFNMSGLSISNLQINKWLQIIGVYKYSDSNNNSIAILDQSSGEKLRGLMTDFILILLLTVFACSMNREDKKLKKENKENKEIKENSLISSQSKKADYNALPNQDELIISNLHISLEHNQNESQEIKPKTHYLVNFFIEKSYILCLLVLFSCSIVKFDLLHVIYFTFFSVLLFVKDQNFKPLWNFVLLVNFFIIMILLYFWNILAINFLGLENETNPDNLNVYSYLGLKINKNSIFLLDYGEHICLYLFGFLHKYFTHEHSITIQNLYKMPEWSFGFSLGICLKILFLMAILKPLSFVGLFYLIFLLAFICINFFLLKEKKHKIVKNILSFLLISSVLTLVIKYSINFSFFVKYIKDTLNLSDDLTLGEGNANSNNNLDSNKTQFFSLQDFGFDNINSGTKLIINVLLIIITKILSAYEIYNYSPSEKDILNSNPRNETENIIKNVENSNQEENKLLNESLQPNDKIENKNNLKSSSSKFLVYTKVFLLQIVHLHSSKIMFISTAFICVCLESMIGLIIFSVLLLSLFIELRSGWKYSFLPLTIISFIVMCFIYTCNLTTFNKWMSKDYEWLGIYNEKSDGNLINDLWPYSLIILMSYLTRISVSLSKFYVERDEPIASSESSDHKDLINAQIINKPKDYEEEAITTLSSFWYKLDYFWYLYGFYMVLIVMVLVSFIKVNLLSLIFMTFVGLQSFGIYSRTDYITPKEDNNQPTMKKIKSSWWLFALFLSVVTFLQYLNFMWFPPSWKIAKPWSTLTFFCAKEGKTQYSSKLQFKNISDYDYCIADWKAWLNIDNYNPKDIFYNFICLFLILLTHKYFTYSNNFFRKKFDIKNETDFTIVGNRTNIWLSIRYFLFIYLKSFILFYIIIISIVYSYRYTNLIYGGFLFISFYLLFKDAALVKQKNNLWKYVQYYNYLVLVTFMLFQTPFLPCPVNRDGRSYIGLEECVVEENRLFQTYLRYDYPKTKGDALYMVMVQTIGVLKLNFNLLIVGNLSLLLIYIVALGQQIIFDHPYQIIVDNYYIREKQINCKSRAFKIVQDMHLSNHAEYRQLYTFIQILNGRLERLKRKITKYDKLWVTDHNKEEVLKLNQNERPSEIQKFNDNLRAKVDQLLSEDKALSKLVDYSNIQKLVHEYCANQVRTLFSQMEDDLVDKNLKSKIKKEKKIELFNNITRELKTLFANQYIKDKEKLYESKDNGLDIAREIFEIMVKEVNEKEKIFFASSVKDQELLEKVFSEKKDEKVVKEVKDISISQECHIVEHNNNPIEVEKEIEQLIHQENQTEISKNENDEISLFPKKLNTVHHQDLAIPKEIANDSQFIYYNSLFENKNQKEEGLSYYSYFEKFLLKSIDKVLLIDLTTNNKNEKNKMNLLELIFFSIFTNIEVFIVAAFIINQCVDASLMSLVFPISYFGYGLVDYPFSNKHYWKAMIVYSIVTITIKLVYQFPFFCGYPFIAVFNVFNDNYCEYYPLTNQEITENFEFILGLRKYNGEYSYPKNAGLLSGILWDVIILCLLLVNRSLLKSKGIWNFVNTNNEFSKVPAFDAKKNEINQDDNSKNKNSGTVYNFFNRLVPELFSKDKILYKPGVDYYAHSFAALLVILIYILFFFGSLTGKSGQGIQDALDKQQFSKELVWTVIVLITIIVIDRVIFKLRSVNNEFIYEKFKQVDNENEEQNIKKGDQNHHEKNDNEVKTDPIIEEKEATGVLPEKNIISNTIERTSQDNVLIAANTQSPIPQSNSSHTAESIPLQDTIPRSYLSLSELEQIETSNTALLTKLSLHYIVLIGGHILIFFVIPLSTKIYFFNNSYLIFLYLLSCLYFYLSARQIKDGFPLFTKGQYFADSTQMSNRLLFKAYRNVPFLYELRAILDWTITKTSLDLFQFFKMECAYANLYEVKCEMEVRKTRRMGEDRWWFEKVSWGFCSFVFLMFILILPMILFSSFNPNLVENKVLDGSIKINLEVKSAESPFVTIYNLNLFEVNTVKINSLKEQNQYDYLKNYLVAQIDDLDIRKIQKVKVVNYSQMDWILSPPAINSLLKNLEKKTDCYLNIQWEFKREFPINNKQIMGEQPIKLNSEEIATLRNIIFALKNHQKPEIYSLKIKDAFPKVIRLSNRQWKYIKFDPKHKTPHKEMTDLQIQLIKENERDIYWNISQSEIKDVKNSPFYNQNDEVTFLLINDDVISSFFGFNSDGSVPLSIIGIYATLVYTVGKFVRIFFDKISQRVIYEEMPNPNKLFELCEGIYISRNQRRLREENDLYDLLIRIYRSPETLVDITGTRVKYLTDDKLKENK